MSELAIRPWRAQDDGRLRDIMQRQTRTDPAWPPGYARSMDLGEWLGRPADLGRWVCERDGRVIGHIGLGSLTAATSALFCASTGRPPERFAELCRTVVDPDARNRGAASMLTRAAIKAALSAQRIPIATVLTGRGAWLKMMLDTGWQRIGDLPASNAGERLVSLLPPQRFVDAVANDVR